MDETMQRPLAVVTGASSGIGLALADELARQGFDLVIAAEDDGVRGAAEHLLTLGAVVHPVRSDLATYDGVEELVAGIRATRRPVDVLAVNAGVGAGGDFTRDIELEQDLQVVMLNCAGSVHLAKRVLPGMVERGSGRVLFTSSIAATAPGPFHSVYAASKAFIAQLSQSLREELRDSGVSVTALMPGPTDTNFFERAGMQDTKINTGPKDDPVDVARDAIEALMAGKDHVVAGSWRNKVQAQSSRVTPATVAAKTQRALTEPGSGDK